MLEEGTDFLPPRASALAGDDVSERLRERRDSGGPKMAKRKKGENAVHGWVVLDKPSGITSTQAVAQVRRIFNAQKAGHAGTLDPLATGILAIALGEATKTVAYVQDAAKIYRFTASWGESRDSDDAEGKITGTTDARPGREAIEAILSRFTGLLNQTPPAYSAIKVQGERAYDLAREGEEVHLEPRPVQVHEARLVSAEPNQAVFEILCGKGTYVRSWVRDIALALGTLGYVSALRRTRIGGFQEKDAVGLETLTPFMHSPAAFAYLEAPFDRAGRHPGGGRDGRRYGPPPQRQSHPHPREFVRPHERRIRQ